MISENLYDVMVVGAGPGGSAAAISLAQMGWNVLLLDKARFPRDKVCGDFISPRSLRVLEVLGCKSALEQAGPNRLNAASLYLNGEQFTAGEIPQVGDLPNYGYTLPRLVFDEILFRQAQASGVETVESCEAKDLTIDADRVTLYARYGGELCRFHSKLVIGADGAHSTVARALGMENRDSSSIIVAVRAYYTGVGGAPSRADIFFDQSFFPGYTWIFPLGKGRANVGLGMVMDVYQHYQINLRERLTDWVENDPVAQARLGGARLDGRIVGWPLNTYRTVGGNYAERVLLIGDAASLVDPINGEGIHMALESACIAAAVADEALQADDFNAAFLSRYEQRWRAAFDLDLRTADLIVTIIKNRSLAGVWLLVLKMIGQKALTDNDYAATCGGILSGVVPTHHSLLPDIMVKTLLHGPEFWQRNLGLSLDRGLASLLDSGLLTASGALDALSEMAGQPTQTIEWGLDVATKGLGVLNGLSQEYSDDLMRWLFDEFFQS
jgi:geranylgeranyl reductase family protein